MWYESLQPGDHVRYADLADRQELTDDERAWVRDYLKREKVEADCDEQEDVLGCEDIPDF